jgi:hypothetical protein
MIRVRPAAEVMKLAFLNLKIENKATVIPNI